MTPYDFMLYGGSKLPPDMGNKIPPTTAYDALAGGYAGLASPGGAAIGQLMGQQLTPGGAAVGSSIGALPGIAGAEAPAAAGLSGALGAGGAGLALGQGVLGIAQGIQGLLNGRAQRGVTRANKRNLRAQAKLYDERRTSSKKGRQFMGSFFPGFWG